MPPTAKQKIPGLRNTDENVKDYQFVKMAPRICCHKVNRAVIWNKSYYNQIQEKAKVITKEERQEMARQKAENRAKAIVEAEVLKETFKTRQKKQPRLAVDKEDDELKGPDQNMHTLTRAELLKMEQLPGPRITNQVILAAKCHAIRDAQIIEKEIIKKELLDEEKRLDSLMDKERIFGNKKDEEDRQKRKEKLLNGLQCMMDQITTKEKARVLEAERKTEESIRINQAVIALQLEEARKIKEKQEQREHLKRQLKLANEESLQFKKIQLEEERLLEERIKEFRRQKELRESKNKADKTNLLEAKENAIAFIAKTQKEELALRDELERLRNVKIQEDVERNYRKKELEAAIKKHKENTAIAIAREKQVQDKMRTIAAEKMKADQLFQNILRQNESDTRKEQELRKKKQEDIDRHRLELMKQINDNEKSRIEEREKSWTEGDAMRLELQHQDNVQRQYCLSKIQQMRQERIDPSHIADIEHTLAKMKII